jgi:hypothetical protein
MFTEPVNTLEQRAAFMDLLAHEFDRDHIWPQPPPAPLPATSPSEEELRSPVARMRPRREVVLVRDGRVRRRRLRH